MKIKFYRRNHEKANLAKHSYSWEKQSMYYLWGKTRIWAWGRSATRFSWEGTCWQTIPCLLTLGPCSAKWGWKTEREAHSACSQSVINGEKIGASLVVQIFPERILHSSHWRQNMKSYFQTVLHYDQVNKSCFKQEGEAWKCGAGRKWAMRREGFYRTDSPGPTPATTWWNLQGHNPWKTTKGGKRTGQE
jgi:hypothetical protein